MRCISVVLAFCFWFGTGYVVGENSTFKFTYTMAMRCKEHLCQHGYSYETFYEINSIQRKTNEAQFEMHVAILASSNGHILLSTVPHPESNDAVYEIVIGGGGNKFTELRRNLRRNAKSSAKTVGILSPVEFRAFYIRMTNDGVIEFGKEGEQLPIISYNDVTPLAIKYFSFAAWNGVEAKFLYDCPVPGDNETQVTPDSKEVENKFTPQEELKRTLLMDRDPTAAPGTSVTVSVVVGIIDVKYNTHDAKVTITFSMVLMWNDENLSWYPDKFNGTKSLKFLEGQIWSPTLFVYNADEMKILNSQNSDLIRVKSSGEALFHFRSQTDSWCYASDDSESYSRWPNEQLSCTVLIGAWEPHEQINLKGLDLKKNNLNIISGVDDVIVNDWETDAKFSIVPFSIWNRLMGSTDNETERSDKLLIFLQMKRRGSARNIALYIPLLVLVTFVLLSFWNKPLQMSRVWFYALCSTVASLGITYMNFLVPGHTVPTILVLYTTVLMGVLLALLVQVILMLPVMERLCKTVPVQSLLTSKLFRMLFCLPVMKICKNYESINEAYAQEDDDSGVMIAPRNGTVEEMEAEQTKYGEKQELAEAIDKLMFFVYSVTFAVMLGLSLSSPAQPNAWD